MTMSKQLAKAQAPTQPLQRPPSPIDGLVAHTMATIERRRGKLENLLPEGLPVERFKEAVRLALSASPELMQCTPESVLLAVLRSARSGLVPDGEMAALVKFGSVATFIPMYKGLIARGKACGLVLDQQAHAVYERDEFAWEPSAEVAVVHRAYVPRKRGEDRGELIATYARTLLPGVAKPRYTVCLLPDLDRAKVKSRSGDRGPWGTDYAKMALKTAIKEDYRTLGVPPGDTYKALRVALAADTEWDSGHKPQELAAEEEPLALDVGPTATLTRELAGAEPSPEEQERIAQREREEASRG